MILRAVTISGHEIENARWEVEIPSLSEQQIISLNVLVSDVNLINYISKLNHREYQIEKDADGNFTVSVTCEVTNIRHMIDTETGAVDTLATVTPRTRHGENILCHRFNIGQCDSRFLTIIRGQS